MSSSPTRKYFLVKHDLESFRALPGFIWRTDRSRMEIPPMFKHIKRGDRWVEFAYIRDGNDRVPCSLVCGFYECVEEAKYSTIPRKSRTRFWVRGWPSRAWMIKGKPIGPQPPFGPVSVRPIDAMLRRNVQKQATVITLRSIDEFRVVCKEASQRAFDPADIPVLGREPENEQEVLSIIAGAYGQLGIRKILRVQTPFPDMLALVGRKEVHFELEYDSTTFKAHLDDLRPIGRQRIRRIAKVRDRRDQRPVAILCWVDGDKEWKIRKRVRNLRIFEMQSLLRERRRIRL